MKKFFTLFAAMLVAMTVSAETKNVSPGSGTLKTAVDGANAGDVLVLADGQYNEGNVIELKKTLTIQAADNAHPVIALRWYMKLLVANTSVTFKGIKFDGGAYPSVGASDHCIRPYDAADNKSLTFIDCEFCNWPSYILYPQKTERRLAALTIRNCKFYDNKRSAIHVETGSSTNLPLGALTIENSTFSNATYFKPSEGVIDVKVGSSPTQQTPIRIDKCTFYNCGAVISDYSADVIIKNSIFAAPSGATYKATDCPAGSQIKNCIAHNISHDSGPTITDGSSADPYFIDPVYGDFTLSANSPAQTASDESGAIGDPRWVKEHQVYLKISADWAGSKYAVYYYKDGGSSYWSDFMTLVDGETDVYTTTLRASGYDKLIFVRLKSSAESTGNWGDKQSQTKNLGLPTEKNQNLFTLNSGNTGDDCDGTWSIYGRSVKFYIAGSMTSWETNQIPVYEDSYTINKLYLSSTNQLKVKDGGWVSFGSLTDKSGGLYPDKDANICFKNPSTNVTVTYVKPSSITTFTVEGTFEAPIVELVGEMNNWGAAPMAPDTLIAAGDNNSSSVTINLAAGNYEFKMRFETEMLSKNGELGDKKYEFNRDGVNTISGLAKDQNNMRLVADIVGDYTFTWTYATGALTVTFPDNGGGTSLDNVNASEKAVKTIENGQLVIIKNGVRYNVLGTAVK